MALSKNNPTTQKSWKSLEKIYKQENGLKTHFGPFWA